MITDCAVFGEVWVSAVSYAKDSESGMDCSLASAAAGSWAVTSAPAAVASSLARCQCGTDGSPSLLSKRQDFVWAQVVFTEVFF